MVRLLPHLKEVRLEEGGKSERAAESDGTRAATAVVEKYVVSRIIVLRLREFLRAWTVRVREKEVLG